MFHRDIQTPRREFKIRRAAEYFDEIRCVWIADEISLKCQKCPGLNANEIHIPQDKHHKVSSLVKSHQNVL